MKKYIAGVLLAAFLFATPAAAQTIADDLCAPYPNYEVNITPLFDEPALNFNANLAEIQVLAQDPTKAIPHYDSVTLGVTRYKPVINFEIPFMKQQLSDGSFCARVTKLNAVIGYRDITVLIAKEFPEGSCAFDHIMTHEQRHITVNRELLLEYVPIIQEKLTSFLKLYGMSIVADPDYAEKLLRYNVNKIFQESTDQILQENMRRQRLIDTPEEYARNNKVCGGDIVGVMRRYLVR